VAKTNLLPPEAGPEGTCFQFQIIAACILMYPNFSQISQLVLRVEWIELCIKCEKERHRVIIGA